jgi:hypothetical protein
LEEAKNWLFFSKAVAMGYNLENWTRASRSLLHRGGGDLRSLPISSILLVLARLSQCISIYRERMILVDSLQAARLEKGSIMYGACNLCQLPRSTGNKAAALVSITRSFDGIWTDRWGGQPCIMQDWQVLSMYLHTLMYFVFRLSKLGSATMRRSSVL